jgi:hypothetical protein
MRPSGARAIGRVHMLGALATLLAGLVLAPAAAALPPAFTWDGRAASSEEGAWSSAADWQGGTAPSQDQELGTLTFPRLTSPACESEEETDACYTSYNDVEGLSAQSLRIDDSDGYFLFGESLGLGAGGISASPEGANAGGAFLLLPLELDAAQRWSIADRAGGSTEENGVVLAAPVSSAANALTIEQSNGSALVLDSSIEVGPLTLEGPNASGLHTANGSVLLEEGELNSLDQQAVDLRHIFFAGTGAVGALRAEGSTLDIGSRQEPAEGIQASSASFDPASAALFEITGSGSTPLQDYSQLSTAGSVSLAGTIGVLVEPPRSKAPCPVLAAGSTYTFVSSAGALSGAFANAPEGGPEISISYGKACSQLAQTMRIAYHRGAGTETVTGTVEEAAIRRGEEQAATKKHEEEAAAKTQAEASLKLAEARARQEGEAAANKKHEEEAQHAVLGLKEAAPDATLASTSLFASASGVVNVAVSCPAGERSCTGTVTLRTLDAVSSSAAGAAKAERSIMTLASGSFTVQGGKRRTVALHLSAKARALLARSHSLRLRVTLVAHNPAGATHVAHVLATLRVAKGVRLH